jgi:hypothetical protein
VRDSLDARLEDIKMNNLKEDAQLPSLWFSLLPILIPLVFICADTFINLNTGGTASSSLVVIRLTQFIHFLGDKNTALLIAALVALLLLISQKKGTEYDLTCFCAICAHEWGRNNTDHICRWCIWWYAAANLVSAPNCRNDKTLSNGIDTTGIYYCCHYPHCTRDLQLWH